MNTKFLTAHENKIRRMAEELRDEAGCVVFRMSTEAGDNFEYINFVTNRLMAGILPVSVKIGGPEARNDIRELSKIGVASLVAPMVESPFGVVKYVEALRDIIDRDVLDQMLIGINTETITSYTCFDDILKIPEAKEIDQINIGLSDFSWSIGKPREGPEIMKMVAEMRKKGKAAGKLVKIGGIIPSMISNPAIAQQVLEEIKPDKISGTGHVICSVKEITKKDIHVVLNKAIDFELALIEYETWQLNNQISGRERKKKKLVDIKQKTNL